MKSQYKFFLLVYVIFIAACNASSVTPTAKATVLLDTTPRPTNSPTPAPSVTSTITPFPTLTGLPTLSIDQQLKWYELLKNNGGCELPCFLGLTPGKTTWQETQLLFETYGSTDFPTPDPSGNIPTLKTYYSVIYTDYGVTLRGGITSKIDTSGFLQNLVFEGDVSKYGIIETYDNHLDWYSISNIFSIYGQPDNIYLYLDVSQNLVYSIDMVYENKEFILEYTGLAKLNGVNQVEICPNFGDGDIDAMRMAVSSPTDSKDLTSLFYYPFWEGPSFEEVSGLNLDEFYQLMTSNIDPACIKIQQP